MEVPSFSFNDGISVGILAIFVGCAVKVLCWRWDWNGRKVDRAGLNTARMEQLIELLLKLAMFMCENVQTEHLNITETLDHLSSRPWLTPLPRRTARDLVRSIGSLRPRHALLFLFHYGTNNGPLYDAIVARPVISGSNER